MLLFSSILKNVLALSCRK